MDPGLARVASYGCQSVSIAGPEQPAGGGPVSRTVWSALYYAQYWTACGGRILRYEPEDSLHGQLSKEVDLKLAAQQLNLAQLV